MVQSCRRTEPERVPNHLCAFTTISWLCTQVSGDTTRLEWMAHARGCRATPVRCTRESPLGENRCIFGQLQIDSIDHGAQILAAGARDLGVSALSNMVEPFVETMTQLMERQTKIPPALLTGRNCFSWETRIQTALEALEALGIPETLGHLDLNPGNIVVSPDRCVFLDWAEAYIGNPFFTFQYLLEHLRRTMGVRFCTRKKPRFLVLRTMGTEWSDVAAIDDALYIAPLLAVFAYAAGSDAWRDEARMQDPATAGYLRSLARRMHREVNTLSERRSLCLH